MPDLDFMDVAADLLSEMRLLVEGAIALYEEDAMSLQSLARDNQQPEAATAFDTIGTALYNLREHLRKLQAMQVAVTESKVSEKKVCTPQQ